jgi:hypothetical protein
MKNKIILSMIFGIIFLSMLSMISAWSPESHVYIGNAMFDEANPPSIIKDCMPYRDSFLAGELSPDISVVYYYSENGKEYRTMHNWNYANSMFQQAVTQDELCFAYGFSSHLIQDSVSHNEVVPGAIKKTGITNNFLHPLLEKKYGSAIANAHPEIKNITAHALDIMSTAKGTRYIEMMQKSLGENTNLDAKNEVAKLQIAVGGNSFFESSYKPRGETLIFRAYPIINTFTNWIQPIVGSVNLPNVDFYFIKARELTENSMNNWGARYQISPHGFDALSSADASVKWFNWIYYLVLFLPSALLIYYTRKWWWIFLVPVVFILEMLIIYMII